MTTANLSERRIIVTRPKKQAEASLALLQNEGFEAVSIPALAIVPISDEARRQKVKQEILALDENALLIFVSQNAVECAFDWIEDYWPQWPSRLQTLSVGGKTHKTLLFYLNRLGCADDMSEYAQHEMNTEELLGMPALSEVKNKKILIFRGVGGRPVLGDELSQRGANVHYCELYHRSVPGDLTQELRAHKVNPGRDILFVYSGESFTNFHRCLNVSNEAWRQLPVVTPSERVKKLVLDSGYDTVVAAKNASDDEMRAALSALIDNESTR